MKSYQVIRTHTSPYQGTDFALNEQKSLESLPGIFYRTLENYDPMMESILITNTHTQLALLPTNLLKKTKLIIHPNSGYDHFADDKNIWKDIPLVIGHQIRAQGVAEYILACLFEGLPRHLSWDKNRIWNRKLLTEKKIWLFGHGHIGQKVSRTLQSLGCQLTIVDPFMPDCLKDWKHGNVSEAEVILVCMSLNEFSHGMFNEEFFSNAHSELLFINSARGKLVQEKALREFLLGHPEAFAYLDVFEKEPFGDDWHSFPQTWKTSHIAGVSKNLDDHIIHFGENVLRDFLALTIEQFSLKYKYELIQNKIRHGVLI